jgi:1-acylglycerone phosphate reductase
MAGKTVLVTGASKDSIGDALVQEFLRRGLHVIATARNLGKIKHLQDLGAEIKELDTTSTTSIESLASQIVKLDILVNNAGVNYIGPLSDTSMADFKHQFQVNVFGTVELTKALLPLLIASKGIIVNHTSQSAYGIPSLCGAYAASKAALANYTDVLRLELAPFDVRVMELVTGGAMSNITNDMSKPFVAENSIYSPVRAEILAVVDPEKVRKMVMSGDVYARKVVGDILRPSGPPRWAWRGSLATTMWFIWVMRCLWKGIFDGLIARLSGLRLLKSRLREQDKKKKL